MDLEKKIELGNEVLSISSPYLEVLVHSSQESIFAIEFSAKCCHIDSLENSIFSSVWIHCKFYLCIVPLDWKRLEFGPHPSLKDFVIEIFSDLGSGKTPKVANKQSLLFVFFPLILSHGNKLKSLLLLLLLLLQCGYLLLQCGFILKWKILLRSQHLFLHFKGCEAVFGCWRTGGCFVCSQWLYVD